MNATLRPFDGDRPISVNAEDLLGFAAAAKHITNVIINLASPEGFVIGIEGEWGSGKSSFINLIANELEQSSVAPETIRFLPWLISSRRALLEELFSEIAKASLRIDFVDASTRPISGWKRIWQFVRPTRYGEREVRREKLQKLFRSFSSHLAVIGKVADVAADLGVPAAGPASGAIKASSNAVALWTARKSLDQEKDELRQELRGLSRKIVVFIDDLDRLEPMEAVEVLRLVRAVADFPNIIYVLCYSRAIVARNLCKALKIDSGEEFIEKIVQATFSVPQPEDFDLRRMFRKGLQEHYPSVFVGDDADTRQMLGRLSTVIDLEGGRTLRTPRHVVRAINSIRFYATPVLDRIDFPDMVWLQLVRLRSVALFRWIEGYMTRVAAIAGGAAIGDGERDGELKALTNIFDNLDKWEGYTHDDRLSMLSLFLPGIKEKTTKNGAEWRLYETIPSAELAELIANRRLGSPQHFRYYFALCAPSGVLSDAEFSLFISKAAEDPDEATSQFCVMARVVRPQGGVLAEALLDRLQDQGIDQVPREAIPGLVMAIANGIDEAARTVGVGDWGKYWIWNDAEHVLKAALRKLTPEQRSNLVETMFATGESLGWLTDLLRSETFGHGIYGDRRVPEEERLLSPAELQIATDALLARYRSIKPRELRRTPSPSSIFYAWEQSGQAREGEIREKIRELFHEDEDLLSLLNVMRGWRSVNGNVSSPINTEELKRYIDFREIERRLQSLSESSNVKIAARARSLLSEISGQPQTP